MVNIVEAPDDTLHWSVPVRVFMLKPARECACENEVDLDKWQAAKRADLRLGLAPDSEA